MNKAILRLAFAQPVCFTTLLIGGLFLSSCGSDKPKPPPSAKVAASFEAACADGLDNDRDGALDCDDTDCQSPGGECRPAPPLDRTVASTLSEAAAYLYQGDNPLQKGVAANALDRQRVAILRGRVLDRNGAALAGANISILGHPEFGYTVSRGDGFFDLAVNGGARLVIDYSLAGYLSLQRVVQPGWQRYQVVPDAGMLVPSTQTSSVSMGSDTSQAIRGERVSDSHGEHEPLVLVEPHTNATAVLSDGEEQVLDHLTVTTTEYPVDAEHRFSPGSLSLQGGLAYGLKFGVKEADELGAERVDFDRPVSLYVEDLANSAVGKPLVVQYYDPTSAQWETSPRGQVIQILDDADGVAVIDSDGDGAPDPSTLLDQFGITDEDRIELARRYGAGQKLWHAEISHFSGWEIQAKGTAPTGAIAPVRRGLLTKPFDSPSYSNGVVVEYQASSFGEPISGTPFTLHYQSNRTLSYGAGRTLEVPLLGEVVPPGLKKIISRITVANRVYEKEFTDLQANIRHIQPWDGTDASGRLLQSQQVAQVSVAFVYADTAGGSEARLPISYEVPLGTWDARAFGLGGFSIDAHHVYDPAQQIIYFGHGGQRSGSNVGLAAATATRETAIELGTPDSLIVAADGSLIFSDDQQGTTNFGRILGVGLDGTPKLLFGDGAPGAAAHVQLMQPQGIVVTSDGRLIVADIAESKIVEVSPDGTTRILVSGVASDNPVVELELNHPDGMAIGPNEELYFVDADKVYRFTAGTLDVVAGGGTDPADGPDATKALLVVPSGLAVDKAGNILVSERGSSATSGGHRVRRIEPDGSIVTVAGIGSAGFSGDGGPAATAALSDPHGLTLDPEGRLYIVDQGNGRIRRIDTDGKIQTIVGGGTKSTGTGEMATNVALDAPDGIAAGPDGTLYIAQNNAILKIYVGAPQLKGNEYVVPSVDGNTLYRFDDRGKHLETLDAITGLRQYKFEYDKTQGLLQSITDRDGNVTSIERNAAGVATAIVAPYGQRTQFTANGSGDIASITDPLNRTTTATWDANGLLSKIEGPKEKSMAYAYDPTGRLIAVSDPTGYQATLGRSELANGWQVDITTPAGQTNFQVQFEGGAWKQEIRYANQEQSLVIDTVSSLTRQATDGTKQQLSFTPDPDWGPQVLLLDQDTVTLPSGRSLAKSFVTSKFFATPGDPFSIQTWTKVMDLNGQITETVIDRRSKSLTHTTPAGRISTLNFDELGHPVTVQAAHGPMHEIQYDAQHRPQTLTQSGDTETRSETIAYDSNGFVSAYTRALGERTTYDRDVMGRLKKLTRPDNASTQWELDDADNVTSLTPPGSQAHLFSYYATSKLIESVTPPPTPSASGTLHFEYDDLSDRVSRLKKITRADGRSIDFGYDSMNRLASQKLGKATLNFYYTGGHMTRINRSDSVTIDQTFDGFLWTGSTWSGAIDGKVAATYDDNFQLSALTVNDASTLSYEYDADGLLTNANANANVGGVTFSRAADGNISGITLGNTESEHLYSAFGELSQLGVSVSGSSTFEQTIVERDGLGRVTHLSEVVQGVAHDLSYEYDSIGRLVKQTRDGIATSYAYDLNGNRTSVQTGTDAAVTATYDAQDRILTNGIQTYSHDAHGDLSLRTNGTESLSLEYDELGNLMKAALKNGTNAKTIEYLVDGLGRRVGRRVNGQFDRKWLYRDSLRPIAEIDADGVFTHFVYASNSATSGAPVALIRAGVFYRVVKDHTGSVRLVINAQTGAVAQSLDYDAYGRVLAETGAGFQPFGFAGGLYDADTKLVRFGARDYDPSMGRWTNKDPIGFAGQQGNVYVYVDGDPVNRVDLGGLGPENGCKDEMEDVIKSCTLGLFGITIKAEFGLELPGMACGWDLMTFKYCVRDHDEHLNRKARQQRAIDNCLEQGVPYDDAMGNHAGCRIELEPMVITN